MGCSVNGSWQHIYNDIYSPQYSEFQVLGLGLNSRWYNVNKFFFFIYFGVNILYTYTLPLPPNAGEVLGFWTFLEFVSYIQATKCLAKAVELLAISYSKNLININLLK